MDGIRHPQLVGLCLGFITLRTQMAPYLITILCGEVQFFGNIIAFPPTCAQKCIAIIDVSAIET